MKQKQRYALWSIAALVCVAAGLFVYFQRGSNSYLHALPQDATALARFDLASLVKDAHLTDEELSRLQQRLIALDDAASTVTATGIDFRKPLYAFVTADGLIGAVAPVANANDLAALCEELMNRGKASPLAQQRGLSWVEIGQQWMLAFDSRKALILGPAVGAAKDELRTRMTALMKQKKAESLVAQPLFESLKKTDDPIAANLTSYVMPPAMQEQLKSLLAVSSLDEVTLRLALDVEPDEIDLDACVLGGNEAVRQRLAQLGSLLRPIKGKLLPKALPDAFAWVGCNVEGATLLEMLRSNSHLRTFLLGLNMAVDADLMLKSIDGDVALEVQDASFLLGLRRDLPVRLMARVRDTDFLQQAPYWMESARGQAAYSISATSPTDFVLEGRGERYWFGTDADILYVAGSESLAHAQNGGSTPLAALRDDMEDARFFATFNVQPLTALFTLFDSQSLMPFLHHFQRLNVKMEEPGEVEFKLKAAPGTNLFKDFLNP